MSLKAGVSHVSECFVKSDTSHVVGPLTIPFSPWDYLVLPANYIQKGLLFTKPPPPSFSMSSFLNELKDSLSLALVHFYPLAGRLSTTTSHDPPSTVVCINYADAPGARLIHAIAGVSVDDILSPTCVPDVVFSFFDHAGLVNHHGHSESLLTLQVTELIDGFFVGGSMNHSAGDGTAFWLFLRSLSQIFKARNLNQQLPNLPKPLFDRRLLNLSATEHSLPYTHPNQFIRPSKAHNIRERFFHFKSETIAKLKAEINQEQNTDTISSLQAVSALVWKSITRARNVPSDRKTACMLACDCRRRMEPQVPETYFGNCIAAVKANALAGELLGNSLGWAAAKIHRAVIEQDDQKIRQLIDTWIKSPVVSEVERYFEPYSVMMGSSPRFDMYGVDFGFGKALAARSGFANKFEGKVSCYPGREGGGSMDLEVCLSPQDMLALELDKEFMNYV